MSDLTLLTGENNTGKTFFATVLHRILDAAPSVSFRPYRPMEETPSQVRDWVEKSLERPEAAADSAESATFVPTARVTRWAKQAATEILESYAKAVRYGISYAYGAEPSELCRKTRSRRARDCFLTIRAHLPSWKVEIRFDTDHIEVTPPDPQLWLPMALDPERLRRDFNMPSRTGWVSSRGTQAYFRHFAFADTSGLQSSLFETWPRHAIHLPADRTGIMQSHNVLAGATAQQSARAGIKPIHIETLSGTSADFLALVLEILEMLASRRRPQTRFDSVVRRFEEHMRASIDIDQRADGIDAIVATTPEGAFPMGRSSSMFTELAPLVLVLKAPFLAVDHLTIDEPEAHLHPEMQVRIASFLAELIQLGIRITVTTHSDFFVSQFKNMMRLHDLRVAGSEIELGDFPGIERSRVRPLHFSRENGWCIASDSSDSGINDIDESTFTHVMRSQYNTTADLINELSRVATASR